MGNNGTVNVVWHTGFGSICKLYLSVRKESGWQNSVFIDDVTGHSTPYNRFYNPDIVLTPNDTAHIAVIRWGSKAGGIDGWVHYKVTPDNNVTGPIDIRESIDTERCRLFATHDNILKLSYTWDSWKKVEYTEYRNGSWGNYASLAHPKNTFSGPVDMALKGDTAFIGWSETHGAGYNQAVHVGIVADNRILNDIEVKKSNSHDYRIRSLTVDGQGGIHLCYYIRPSQTALSYVYSSNRSNWTNPITITGNEGSSGKSYMTSIGNTTYLIYSDSRNNIYLRIIGDEPVAIGRKNSLNSFYADIRLCPNPCNPVSQLTYTLLKNDVIGLWVFNSLGRLVHHSKPLGKMGMNSIPVNLSNKNNGMYVIKLQKDNRVYYKNLCLIK